MESERHLHIRAAAGEPAAYLPLRHDHRGRAYGLREDHGGELVSGRARVRAETARVVRISVYSDNLAILWRSAQDALPAGLGFLREYDCPADDVGGSMLAVDLCHELAGDVPCYLFLDDFHLLTDRRVTAFLCTLAGRLPGNVHLIVASRGSLSARRRRRCGWARGCIRSARSS